MHLNNELYHHGVLGMKWGVRRYQNKDGSLTAKGKKKYLSKVYKDAQNHFYSKIENKHAKKTTALGRNLYDNRGSAWIDAYKKKLVTAKDDTNIRSAAKQTRDYVKAKYGEEIFRALSRSGVMGRTIDDFNPNATEAGRKLVNDMLKEK